MIGTSIFVGLGIMVLAGIVLPLSICIWWCKRHGKSLKAILAGVLSWFGFAIILESIPKLILFNPATGIGNAVLNNVVLFTVFGALLAGVFEETGRYVIFKTLLKKDNNKETAISHGIGHGGFEAMYLLVLTGVQYIVFAWMINNGTFQGLIDKIIESGVDASAYIAFPEQIAAMKPWTVCLTMIERVFAIMFHISLSIIVFCAVKQKKIGLYVLAILLHMAIDVPAALYQFGTITNMLVVEIIFVVFTVAVFIFVYKKLYVCYNIDSDNSNQEERIDDYE